MLRCCRGQSILELSDRGSLNPATPVGVFRVLIGLLSTTWLSFRAFPCCTLAGMLNRGQYYDHAKLLTLIVDNFAEKVDGCMCRGSIFCAQVDREK